MTDKAIIHIIDDDPAARDSLQFLLQASSLDVRIHESALSLLSNSDRKQSGCIVTDVKMPGMTGIDLLHRLKELAIDLPVIVMTGHGDVPLAVEAMKSGAIDFIEKPFSEERILAAISAAMNVSQKTNATKTERAMIEDRVASLSHRERQVLAGLVAGEPNKVIASNLGISPRTVEIYRANVMTKMTAGSLSELVRMALTINLELHD